MPPRYAYWTIIVDEQATAFRAGSLEDIMPTFNRLKEKQPSAKLMWFQSGKLWPSRVDAREAMQMRGERGRDRDPRQAREPGTTAWKPRSDSARPAWKTRDDSERPAWKGKSSAERPAWKPKGDEAQPAWKPKSDEARPAWKPKSTEGRSAWKPKSTEGRSAWKPKSDEGRPAWKPKSTEGGSAWKPKGEGSSRPRPAGKTESLEWNPKGSATDTEPRREASEGKRKWIPKAEYKKMTGTEAPRDQKWRPGGEHKDPRQKYKDAKKAKWTRVKQTIRARTQKPRGKT